MERLKRHRIDHRQAADLDVTPFMNLMIVLVPVLLLSMVFTHTTVIDLNFPSGEGGGDADPEAVHLEVLVTPEALIVADGRGGVIKQIPNIGGGYDYAQLSLVMQEVKRRLPDKQDITILLEEDTDYQTLVFVMDRVRSFKTMHEGERVDAELFPAISLGDSYMASNKPKLGRVATR